MSTPSPPVAMSAATPAVQAREVSVENAPVAPNMSTPSPPVAMSAATPAVKAPVVKAQAHTDDEETTIERLVQYLLAAKDIEKAATLIRNPKSGISPRVAEAA